MSAFSGFFSQLVAATLQAMMQQDEEMVAMANTLTGARVCCAL